MPDVHPDAPSRASKRLQLLGASLRGQNDVDAVRSALDCGWPVDAPLPIRQFETMEAPLLWWAVRSRNTPDELVQLLLDRGADVNQPLGQTGVTPFIQACISGQTDHLRWMLATGRVDLLTSDRVGWTPALALVAATDHEADPAPRLEALQATFEKLVWPSRPDLRRDHLWRQVDGEGRSAFVLGGASAVQWLLRDARFDFSDLVNHRSVRGETAMGRHCGNLDCLGLLLRAGARVDDGPGSALAIARHRLEKVDDLSTEQLELLQQVEAMLSAGLAKQTVEAVLNGAIAKRFLPAHCA